MHKNNVVCTKMPFNLKNTNTLMKNENASNLIKAKRRSLRNNENERVHVKRHENSELFILFILTMLDMPSKTQSKHKKYSMKLTSALKLHTFERKLTTSQRCMLLKHAPAWKSINNLARRKAKAIQNSIYKTQGWKC